MNQNVQIQDSNNDEINLWELIARHKSGWYWIVAGGGLGLACATGLLFLTPSTYEATAVIQPGTQPGTNGMSSSTMPIEPSAEILERLRLVTFYDDDMVKACRVGSPKDVKDGVRSSVVKGTNLISIAYRADSANVAKICLAKIVEKLTQIQKTIAEPQRKLVEEKMDLIKRQIDEVTPFRALGEKRIELSNESIFEMLKRDDIKKLQATYLELQIQFSEPLTRPMRLLGPIHSPETAVHPKKLMTGVIGLISGVGAGMLALFIYLSWRRYRSMLVYSKQDIKDK